MVQNAENVDPPLSPLAGPGGYDVGAALAGMSMGAPIPGIPHDGASAYSDGPFSGADAAVMAEAFRTTLRQPDFIGRPVEEGESPEATAERRENELLTQRLAEEGRDLRSVSSSRGVRVNRGEDDEATIPEVPEL